MFIGFAFGTLCLVGLAHAFSHRRWHGRWHSRFHPYRDSTFADVSSGCAGPSAFGAYDEPRHGAPPWGGPGRRAPWDRGRDVVLSLFRRIDATPAQERAILAALDDLKDVARGLGGTTHDARADIGRAFAGPEIDDSAFDNASARLDEAATKLRAELRRTLVAIHAVLDDRQRKEVAEMIGSRWGF